MKNFPRVFGELILFILIVGGLGWLTLLFLRELAAPPPLMGDLLGLETWLASFTV